MRSAPGSRPSGTAADLTPETHSRLDTALQRIMTEPVFLYYSVCSCLFI